VLTGEEAAAVVAYRTSPMKNAGNRGERPPGAVRRDETWLPEFAERPVGGSGLTVPAHHLDELGRRRAKLAASGAVVAGL
jgi:hypothetical protein